MMRLWSSGNDNYGSFEVITALTTERLRQAGLVFLSDYYLKISALYLESPLA